MGDERRPRPWPVVREEEKGDFEMFRVRVLHARSPRDEMFEASFMGERFCKAADDFCSGAIQGPNADQRDHVGDPVTWLTSRFVTSPRYAYAMVLPSFTGLTGATVLRPASDLEGDRFAE